MRGHGLRREADERTHCLQSPSFYIRTPPAGLHIFRDGRAQSKDLAEGSLVEIYRSKIVDEGGVAEMFACDYRYREEAWAPQESGIVVSMDIIGCAILR